MTTFNIDFFLISSLPRPPNFQFSSLPPVLLVPLKQGPLVTPLPFVLPPSVLELQLGLPQRSGPRKEPRASCVEGRPQKMKSSPALQSLAPSWAPAVGAAGESALIMQTAVPLQGVPLSAYLSPPDRQTPGGRNLTPDVPSESSPKLHH